MKTLILSLILTVSSLSVFAQDKSNTQTRTNQQRNAGGGDAGGAVLTTMAAPLMPGDFKLAMKAAQEHLPAVLRSLELQMLTREFRFDTTAFDFAEKLTHSKIFGEGPVDVSTAESLILKLNNINVYSEAYKVGKTTLGNTQIRDMYNEVSEWAGYSVLRYEMYTEFTEKLFAQSQIYKLVREITVEVQEAPCRDEKNSPVAASIYSSNSNAICLSKSKIEQSQLINRNNILPTILGLIIHELGHKAGIKSERFMYALQIPLVKDLAQNDLFQIGKNFVGFASGGTIDYERSHYQIQLSIANVEFLLKNISRFTDLRLCNELSELAEEAQEIVVASKKYRRLFWATNAVQYYKNQVSIAVVAQASRTYCQQTFRNRYNSGSRDQAPNGLKDANWKTDSSGMRSAMIAEMHGPSRSFDDLRSGLYENVRVVLARHLVKEDMIENLRTLETLYKKDLEALNTTKAENFNELRIKVRGL